MQFHNMFFEVQKISSELTEYIYFKLYITFINKLTSVDTHFYY